MKRLDDKINGNPNDLATASSAKEPRLEEESSEGGARGVVVIYLMIPTLVFECVGD